MPVGEEGVFCVMCWMLYLLVVVGLHASEGRKPVSESDGGGLCVHERLLLAGKSDITQLFRPLQSLSSLKDTEGQLDQAAKPHPLSPATGLLPVEQQGQWSRR